VDFTVTGRMPAHARVHATPVEREDEEGNPMLAAYDITLTDEHNQEWQPAYGQPAQVTITDPGFGNGRKLDIFHETEEGREYVTTVVSVNNTVTFPAKHFSVYVIGTPNGKNRMAVAFVKTRHNDAYPSPDSLLYDTLYMLVKRADTIYNGKFMTRLVYPPNPGYIPKGANFFGWSQSRNYTAAPESRMTIDVVRELVYDRLKNGEEITKDLGDTMMFYSVLLKSHTINYRSLRNPNVVIGVDQVLYLLNDNPVQDYIVNESYIPTEANANFQGWLLMDGDTNIVEGTLPDDIYPNGTPIKIKGPVIFMEELAYGYWLVFNENGKGASYTAPKFLKSNDAGIAGDTLSEAQPDPPTRYGYNFGGWYADPTFDTPFVFKGYLNQDTIIHAKWVTKEQAYYTIIVWRQNVARNGYDFAESFSLEGDVGYSIASQAIVTGKEGDLDYVTVNGKKLGGIKWVLNGQESDPYTGFTISSVNPIVDQAVTTDGKAVVNIYFDRMKYKLKLYVVRTNANGNGNYTGTSIGKSLNPEAPYFLGDWGSGKIVTLSAIPKLFDHIPPFYDVSGSYRYYYDTITAYYGENIKDRWPTHNNITVSGSNYFISWFLMSTAKAFVPGANGTGNGTGGNTLKGEVHILDEQILGRLDDSTSNLLLARYAPTYCDATFYYYFANADGSYPDTPSDTVFTRAGQNNYEFLLDKAPSFEGYTYDADSTTGTNGSSYVLRYHYRRKAYSITFRDGAYLDGNGDELQNNSSNTPLRIMTGVKHGANIDTLNSYVPTLPLTEGGFVFDGWYMDEACSRRYEFDKMPMGNLVVYARWRQIQYRVFLHPQAGTDPSLNWGNDSQAMNFRVSYGGKVSAPTGQRDLYEFGGWYLDSTYQNRFFAEVSTLTEQNVTTPYVKNVDMTDNMDKWGVIHNPDIFPYVAYNSDTIVYNSNGDIISNKDTVDRFWITKKLDLYARWRHKLDGAEGVKVEYVCDECEPSTMPQADEHLYLDKSKMVARPAATSAVNNKIFAYWVLQNWNPASASFVDSLDANGKPVFVYPGGPYTLHLPYTRRKQIPPDSVVYLYQLRAELESFEDDHTFIVWYRNWGKLDGDTVRYDAPDTLHINMMVPIPSAEEVGTREGYIYKGWHKKGYGPEGSGQENTFEDRLLGDTATVNSIWYNPEDGHYYSKDYSTLDPDSLEFYRAYGVGADEVTPYDYFYAVWEPIKYTIRFDKNTTDPSVTGDMPDQVFKYGEEQDLSKIGYLYQCHKFLGWATSADGEVVYSDQQALLNLTAVNGAEIDLYAKWEGENPTLVVSPDSATCLNPGSIKIRLEGITMPNYTYRVIGLNASNEYKDTVWQVVSSGTQITASNLHHRAYRVEVVTGSQCVVQKDTAVFLNPVEVPWDNPIATVCKGSPFVIKPSSNDDVRYLWDKPTKREGAVVFPDTANNNDPQEYILCTIENSADSSVSYKIHAILGNCELGDVPTTIDVSTANYPPFEITISAATDTLCGGTPLEVTARVNDGIYHDNYTLKWVFKGDTVLRNQSANVDTVIRVLQMPDTCRGDFSVEVYYADVTECHVNAVKNFKVRIADWNIPANQASTIDCVKDTVRPHTIEPSIMPVVQDGCGNTLIPTLYNTVVEPADLTCDGTVTYTYEYEDCEGKEKYWDYVYHVDKQAPEITITEVPAPTPIDFCRYQIPEIGYTLSDCDPTLVTVTQTPSATDHIRQIDKDSVVTITLTATDKCGLTATKNTTVTIPARPTVTPTAKKPEFCLGDTTRVTAATTGTSSGSTITWTVEPATGLFTYADDTTFSATAHGTYTLTATVVENGCLATGETSVTVKPSAELTVTNQNQTICFGASISNVYITLLYTDNLETSGNLPAGVTRHDENNGSVISGTPTQAGVFKYYLTASSQDHSCGVTKDSVSIEILPFTEGTVSISGDTVFCEGKSTRLSVDPDAKSYKWANSDGILPYTKSYLTVIEPGTYSVTVTSLDGCISTGSQIVTRNPRPSVELVLPSPICPEDNVQQLQANITDEIKKPEYTYYWITGKDAAFNGTEHSAMPTLTMLVPENCATIYYPVTLILEDSSGCQKTVSDSILMINVPPTISRKKESITLSPNAYCQYFIPNQQALDTLVNISGNCTPTEDLSTSIFYPSATDGNIITSTDSITITVTDACNHSARTKIEVKIPEGMPVQERDSLVLNSFEWEGITYNESTTVESEDNNIGHSCSIDRANITVLHTNRTDTAICEGGTANLIVNVDRPVLPAVGDVLCLKGTAAPYDTLVLRPDTFVARATADALTPIGVVFYVDPADNWLVKALALVDACSAPCKWSENDNKDVNDGNNDNNNSHLKAAYDINGYSNTASMIATATTKPTTAPAAQYCYYYNPLTKSGTGNEQYGWYLPAAGELSIYFAQRVQVNQTLQKLSSYSATIPLVENGDFNLGYWSSTDYNNYQAEFLNQKGQYSNVNKTTTKNVRAVYSCHLTVSQPELVCNVGDLIGFKDGSKGVVCYVSPDNPYKGWAVALQDINNPDNDKDLGLIKILAPTNCGISPIYPSIAAPSNNWNNENPYARYNLNDWQFFGKENTAKLFNNNSAATNAMESSSYKVSDGWYIPDMMQLRQWYSLFPVIKDIIEANGGKLPNWSGENFYWSSTGTKTTDFGCMYFPNGDIQTRSVEKNGEKRAYHIRPVRDFDLSISWDNNNAVASSNPLADTMQVSPSATQKYYATVKFCGWTLRDSATVTVVTKPVIKAKNGTEVRNLGCNPATIPTMTVDSFTVEDNSKPDAKVTLTHRDTSGIECSLTWMATYQNQCGQKADTVRVTYRWTQLSVKADTLSKTYDGESLDATYSYTPIDIEANPTFQYKVKTGDEWGVSSTPSITDAGTLNYLVEATYGNCTVSDTATLTITPKPVTVTANSEAFTYDGNAHSNSGYVVNGLLGDDAITAVVTGSITFPSESPVTNELTSYQFTAGNSGNYSVTTEDGQLTMTTAAVAITITAASDEWTYDGDAHQNTTVAVTEGTLFDGDVLVAEATGSVTNVSDTQEGNNPIAAGYKVMHGEEDVTANYAITAVDGTLTINPKTVTVTAQDKEFVYTGEAQSWPEYDVDGLIGNDDITAVVTGSITFPSEGTVTNELTGYEFTSGTAGNYSVETANGELTMTKASVAITITAASQAWTYDGDEHSNNTVTVTSGELLFGDILVATATGSVTNVADNATGNNPIAAGYKIKHGTEDVTENYAITTVDGTLTINKKIVTVSVEDKSVEYNGDEQNGNTQCTFSNLLTGHTATITYTPSHGTLVGEHTNGAFTSESFSVVDANNNDVTGNYTLETMTSGKLTITNRTEKYAITVVAKSSSGHVYDGTEKSVAGFETTSFNVGGHTYTVSGLTTSDPHRTNAGSSTNAISGTAVVKDAANNDVTNQFNVTTQNGTLEIAARGVTVSVADRSVEYNGSEQYGNTAYNFNNLLTGHTATMGYTPASGTQVGEYTNGAFTPENFSVVDANNTVVTNNYTLETKTSGKLTITQNTTTLYVESKSKSWDYTGNPHTNHEYVVHFGDAAINAMAGETTGTYTATLGTGDVVTITPTSSAKVTHVSEGEVSNTFTWTMTNESYYTKGTDVVGKLKVNPAALTVTTNTAIRQYNGQPLTADGSISGLVTPTGGVQETVTFTVTGTITKVGGPIENSYSLVWNGTAAESDYTVSEALGTLTISQNSAEIKVTPGSGEKTYDGTPLTKTAHDDFTVTGLPEGFTWTATADGTVTNVTPGEGEKAVNAVTDFHIFKGSADVTDQFSSINTTATGTLEITPRAVTLTSGSKTRQYNGTALTNAEVEGKNLYGLIVETGWVGSEGATYSFTGSQLTEGHSANTFAYTLKSGTKASNYAISKTEGLLTITENTSALVITSSSKSWTYDGNNHTDEIYMVSYGGATVAPDDATGKVFTLPTGDKVTITSTASGVTQYSDNAAQNNTYTYVLDNANQYQTVTANAGTLSIERKAITISALPETYTYTGTAQGPAGTHTENLNTYVTCNTLALGDVLSGITLAGSELNVGTYNDDIEPSLAVIKRGDNIVTGNYDITYTKNNLTIDPAEITLTCPSGTAVTKVYDNNELHPSATATGVISSDVITIEYSTDNGTTWNTEEPGITDVGTQPVLVQATHSNYITANCDYMLVVSENTSSVVISSSTKSWTYDGTTHQDEVYTVIYDGATVNPDDATGKVFTLPTHDKLTITPTAAGVTYYNNNAANNNNNTYTYVLENAGNYSSVIAYYGTLSIKRKDLTIAPIPKVYTYNGTDQGPANTYTNGFGTYVTWSELATGDELSSITLAGSRRNAGTYANDIASSNAEIKRGNVDVTGNYNITYAYANLTIHPATITLICPNGTDITKPFDGSELHPSATATGVLSSDVMNIEYSTDNGTTWSTSVPGITYFGTKPVLVRATNSNYHIAECGYTLSITRNTSTINVTPGSGEKTYDGTPLTKKEHDDFTVTGVPVGFTWTATADGTVTNVTPGANEKAENAVTDFHIFNTDNEDVTNQFSNINTTAKGTLTITARPITLKANNASNEYIGSIITYATAGDAVSPYYTLSSGSLVVGHNITAVTLTGSGTTAGSYDITITEGGVTVKDGSGNNVTANYTIARQPGTLTISQNSAAIVVVPGSGSKTYDGTPLTKMAHDDFTVTGLPDGFTWTATADGTVTNVTPGAGEKAVNAVTSFKIFKGSADVTDQFSSIDTSTTGTLTITARPITLKANNASNEYTGSAITYATAGNAVSPYYTIMNTTTDGEGLASGHSITDIALTGSGTTTGSYDITITEGSVAIGGNTANYDITLQKGTLTIGQNSATITVVPGSGSKTYDGSPLTKTEHEDFTVTGVPEGFTWTATADGTVTNVTPGADEKAVNAVTSFHIFKGGTDVTNQFSHITKSATGTLTINRRPVTVTAKSEEFIYDGTAHNNPGYDVDGLVGSDAINAVVSGSITFPNQSPVTNALANYQFTSGTPGNYNVTTANGQLTMTNDSVEITITAASGEWIYDGNAHSNSAVSVTSGALLSGDQLVATATGSAKNVEDTEAGNNQIAAGYKIMHGTQDVTENYVITPVNGKLTIKPKGVTVTAENKSFVYTGAAQSWPQYVVSGLVGSDAITATITSNITFPSQSPVPNVVDSYSFTTGAASNYTVSLESGQLTMVNAAVPITITAASQEWTYDGDAHTNDTVKVTSGTLLTGDSLVATATGSVTSVADNATSNNPIAPGYKVMHGTEDVTANYVFTTQFGKLTIKPKAVTVTANSDAFTYDGTAHSNNGYVVNGLEGSDAISAVVTGSITFPSQSPATNTLTSYQFTAGTPGNYSVTKVNGQLTMTPANIPITITAASDSKTYDGTALTNATVTVTSGSLLTGDTLVATATGSVTNVWETAENNNSVAEGYQIMHGTQDVTANYTITPMAGTLVITPRTVTVSVADKTVEYNGAVQNGNTACTFNNVVAGQTATIGYTAANGLLPSETPYDNSSYDDNFTVMAGTTDVTSNYTLTEQTTGKLTIKNRTNKYSITVVAKSNTGNVYDGTVKSASGFQTLVFSFNSNPFTVSGLTTSNPSSANVCELANTISGTAVVNDAQGNDVTSQFNVTTLNGVLEILKRPVTVSVADKTVDYNGSVQYGSTDYTFSNVVSGQTATIDYLAANGTTESPTPYNNGSYGSNFKVTLGETNVTSNYTLTLKTKGKLKINPAPLIVTAKDSTKIYDGLALLASYTYESNESQPTIRYKVKSGDTWSDYLTDAPSITNAGSLIYLVEASISSYTTSDTATLTVTKRDVTVTVADTLNIEYTGSEHHSDKEPVFHNVVAGQTPHITYHPAHGIVVGEYVGNYVTESFKVTRGATDVTANYNLTNMTPGRLTIVNRSEKYTLNVVAKSDTNNIYDGITHYAIGYDTVVHLNDHLFTVTGLTTSNPSSKNVCEMTNTLSGTPVVKDVHGNDVTNQFNVNLVNGLLRIKPRSILLRSIPGVKLYDSIALTRNAQSDVIVEGAGFVGNEGAIYHITGSQRYVGMSYNTFTYTLKEGTLASNYLISTQFGTLTVNPDTFSLVIESKPGEWVFDNQTHRRDEYRVVYKNVARTAIPGTNGLKFALPTMDTLTITPTFNGITHISENADSNNTFTYTLQHSDWFAGKRDTVFGTLKILPRSVNVHIVGNAKIKSYTGYPQSVTGYTVYILDSLYKASYFEYNGDSIATRQDSGKTMMNLQASEFTNLNHDFAPVNFEITDGEILITPDTGAAVILAGRHSMVDYNGQSHSVYGYEIISITDNYSASDFEFIGTWEDSTATRTNAGITWMGLSDTMFRNVNPNFHDVTFVLQSDGYQQINSIEATVKVTGRADTREYDGTEHSITGYDLEISPSLYTANDFTFNGHDTAKRIIEGTTWMGLDESQFVNTNPNFHQVIFTITDGKQTITPNASALTLHCPSGDTISKMYDGTPLSVAATASSTIPNDVFDIKYKTKLEGQSTWSDWSSTPPSITDFGILFVEVSCSNPNYMPQSCTYALSIHKRNVHLKSMDSTRIYNGDILRYDSVKVTGDGFVNGEGATYLVTGGQLLPGSAPNLFDYTLNPGTLAENYEITKSYGTLHVDKRPDSLLYQITVVSKSNPEANGSPIIYDGLKHTASNFVSLTFTTADGHPYTVTWLSANVSAFDAGSYPNTIHGEPTVLDEYGNDVTDQFLTELVEGELVIRKRQVTITVPSDHATMMYNGDSLKVDFENIDITTLADRDTLKSGYVISEGYTAGAYHCNDGFFMATDMTGVASQHNFSIIHGASDEYSAGNSMTNYRPQFQVTLTITKRPLEITASSAEKDYDGEPLTLTESDYTLTNGTTLAPTDTLIITRTGSQSCVGESANHITSVKVLHKSDGVDVTSSYNITTVDGLLKVTRETDGLTSPNALHITLTEDTYDTLISQSLLGTPNCSLLEAGVGVVSNDLDEHNPLTAGTHTITWILFDTCQTAMDTCYQTVEVVYTPCVGVEYYDHLYTAERIGFQCWMTENLRNTLNSQEETIANYHAYKENSDNIAKFGYLYSWYSAMNVTENDNSAALTYSIGDNGQPYVQGICPNGWAVGSLQDYTALLATVGDSEPLKDAGDGYWLPSFGGTLPNSGFNARGNGFYNSVSQRYEDLLTGAHFWMPESATADGVTVNNFVLQYYCPDAKFQHNPKGDRKGVRCIRKVAP